MKADAMSKPMDAAQIFQRLAELAGAYRDGQVEGGYVTYLPPAELARRLELDRPAPPGDWDEIFRWVELYLRYSVKTGHPGYMNRMWSSANLPSVLGEMVTALSNTSACTFETAPVSTLMEQYLLQAMLDLVGFPKGSGQMTTGSSNANLIALLIARNQASQAKNKGLFTVGWQQLPQLAQLAVIGLFAQLGAKAPEREQSLHAPEGDDLGNSVAAVALHDVLQQLVPPLVRDVGVDIGHADPLRVQEALEQQLVLQRVQIRDAEAPGDQGPRGRPAPRSDGDGAVLRRPNDACND